MFGISFSELLLVGLVALLVLGPSACRVLRAPPACGSGG
jgi:Sec-independent protein translocase protein TatA